MKTKLFFLRSFISFTILCVCSSCNSKVTKEKAIDLSREMITKNKVKTKTTIKVFLDTAGKSLWSRPDAIDFYNDVGLRTMTIYPKYEIGQIPPPPPGGLSLEQLVNLRAPETNIPTGQFDTTFYEYDNNSNLTTTKNSILTTIKYDSHNNWIEKCISSKLREDICNYRVYEYDKDGQIVYSLDSAGVRASVNGHNYISNFKKQYYKYDKNGNTLFDGQYLRAFNDKNQLIEQKEYSENNLGDKYNFEYNKEGMKTCETLTRVISSSLDTFSKEVSNVKTVVFKTYFYYNDKGLIKQKKELDQNNKLISLENFEYSYN